VTESRRGQSRLGAGLLKVKLCSEVGPAQGVHGASINNRKVGSGCGIPRHGMPEEKFNPDPKTCM
jgi:hypothetical protein